MSTINLASLRQGLSVWPNFVRFLNTTKIGKGDKDDYQQKMEKFEE